MTDQIFDDPLGSHRLPTDPPTDLDGRQIAQKIWIRLVSSIPALRVLDFQAVVDYCILAEQLAEVQEMLKTSKPHGLLNKRLRRRVKAKTSLMVKIYHSFYPGTPPEGDPPGTEENNAFSAAELEQLEELRQKVSDILHGRQSGRGAWR